MSATRVIDDGGRIVHVAQLPTGALAPGTYTVRLTVAQGDQQETRESSFTLAE